MFDDNNMRKQNQWHHQWSIPLLNGSIESIALCNSKKRKTGYQHQIKRDKVGIINAHLQRENSHTAALVKEKSAHETGNDIVNKSNFKETDR